MKNFLSILILQLPLVCFGQDTTSENKRSKFIFSGYADIYYQYDFNKPADKLRPAFLYNFKKNNEVNVNLALLKGNFESKKLRANLGVMSGNYSKYNLSAEPKFFRHIYEANIGYKFSDNVSIDVGILPSHIGCESAIAKDNWNLSRSILAENSPYYETGIKLNFNPNEKWSTSLLIVNGWQNIKDYNSSKAVGTQIVFKPDTKWIFSSSTFLGNEKPDMAKQLRLFHNLHITYTVSDKLKTLFMLDLGAERKPDRSGYNNWMGTAFFLQYSISEKFSSAARLEFYKDKNGVIVSNYFPLEFKTTGVALNIDYRPAKNLVIRTEVRSLNASENILERNTSKLKSNFAWLTVVAFYF